MNCSSKLIKCREEDKGGSCSLPRGGYKTPGPVSRCHLGENLSGLRVPSDWIIMNNEWGFMLHWSINKMGVTGRHSGHRKHPGPPGGRPPSRWPRRIWGSGRGLWSPALTEPGSASAVQPVGGNKGPGGRCVSTLLGQTQRVPKSLINKDLKV